MSTDRADAHGGRIVVCAHARRDLDRDLDRLRATGLPGPSQADGLSLSWVQTHDDVDGTLYIVVRAAGTPGAGFYLRERAGASEHVWRQHDDAAAVLDAAFARAGAPLSRLTCNWRGDVCTLADAVLRRREAGYDGLPRTGNTTASICHALMLFADGVSSDVAKELCGTTLYRLWMSIPAPPIPILPTADLRDVELVARTLVGCLRLLVSGCRARGSVDSASMAAVITYMDAVLAQVAAQIPQP